jgi:hypothetical protein
LTAAALQQNIPVAKSSDNADEQKKNQYSFPGAGIAEIDEFSQTAAPGKERIFRAFFEPALFALLADDFGGKGKQAKSEQKDQQDFPRVHQFKG